MSRPAKSAAQALPHGCGLRELRAVGQTLTAKLDGEILGTARDETFPQGEFGVRVPEGNTAPAMVKTFDILDLDAPGGASLLASGSKTKRADFQDYTLQVELLLPFKPLGGGQDRANSGVYMQDR